MALFGRILDVIGWVVALVGCVVGALLSCSPLGFMFPGGMFLVFYAVVFMLAWSAACRRCKLRSMVSVVAVLGAIPFAYGACPGVGIHPRGMAAAEHWLALIDSGQTAEAHSSADLEMSLADLEELVKASGLQDRAGRTLLGRGDIGYLLEEVHFSIQDRLGSTRVLSVVLRMQFFAAPVVTDVWIVTE